MNRSIFCIPVVLASFFINIANGQDLLAGYEQLFTTPKQYTVYKANGPIKIDGKLKEASWDNADWSDDFIDIESDRKPRPPLKTRFKML